MNYDILNVIEAKYRHHAREEGGQLPNMVLMPFAKFGDFLRQAEERQGYPFGPNRKDIWWHGMLIVPTEIHDFIVVYRSST